MINKDSFVKIVDGLRDYWDAVGVFQDSLNVYMEHNFMTDIFDTVISALYEDVELNVDDNIGPILYYYACECDWGRNEKAKEGLPSFGAERASLTSAEELYDYLMLNNGIYEYVASNVIEMG
jgi:hypothetical protein